MTTKLAVFGLAMCCLLMSCKKKNDPIDNVYRFEGALNIDGRERTYLLNLPPDYYESDQYSLIIAMHGGGGSAQQFETSSGLTIKANASNFIVVYPDGVKSDGVLKAQTWNAGGCCDFAAARNIDDVKFISILIDELVSKYKINPKKVYATGHSNGGMMSYRLACELSNKIAAIAPNACTMVVTSTCNASRAVPVLHMHSKQDENVPYQGGYGIGVSDAYYPPVDSTLNVWSNIDACMSQGEVVVENAMYTMKKWTNCNANSSIIYYLTTDGGHAWPGGSAGSITGDKPSAFINANDLLWEFFQGYTL